ncbi:MAG TPA: hypothetical protein V6C97_14435 [Oculatellaceae cyanobacterium]
MNKTLFYRSSIAMAVVLSTTINVATAAALSSGTVVSAINQADVFAGDSRFSVKVDGEHVSISTYKTSVQDDTENKMQAIFATKALMEAVPGQVTRATFYFYDFDNLSTGNYKQVDVTAGDIKAFGSGQLKEKELLSSITITSGQLPDAASRIASFLSSKQDYPVTTAVKDNELVLSSQIDRGASDTDVKYRALKLATDGLRLSPHPVKTVRVDLSERGQDTAREVVFDANDIKSIMNNLTQALAPVKIASKQDISELKVADGPFKAEREQALEGLKSLSNSGVGVAPFVAAFKAIEKELTSGDESKIASDIKHLLDNIERQQNARKDAHQEKAASSGSAQPAVPAVPLSPRIDRWILGREPIFEAKVLSDPDGYIKELETLVTTPQLKADDNQRFAGALMYFAQTLRLNNRPQDAVRFERRLASIRAKHPKF